MLAEHFAGIVPRDISWVVLAPWCISSIRGKAMTSISPVVPLEDQPRHLVSVIRIGRVQEDITHGAIGDGLRSRGGWSARIIKHRRPLQAAESGPSLRREGDVFDRVAQNRAIQKPV